MSAGLDSRVHEARGFISPLGDGALIGYVWNRKVKQVVALQGVYAQYAEHFYDWFVMGAPLPDWDEHDNLDIRSVN